MRTCQICGAEIIKKSYESKAHYEKKKFCSQACFQKYMRENKMGWFNPTTRQNLKPSYHKIDKNGYYTSD